MRVCFDFSDDRPWAELDLDGVPRVGEGVCWMSSEERDGQRVDVETGYRVEEVEWAFDATGVLGAQVVLQMAPMTDLGAGRPVTPGGRW